MSIVNVDRRDKYSTGYHLNGVLAVDYLKVIAKISWWVNKGGRVRVRTRAGGVAPGDLLSRYRSSSAVSVDGCRTDLAGPLNHR